jgi:hypothetical protein
MPNHAAAAGLRYASPLRHGPVRWHNTWLKSRFLPPTMTATQYGE